MGLHSSTLQVKGKKEGSLCWQISGGATTVAGDVEHHQVGNVSSPRCRWEGCRGRTRCRCSGWRTPTSVRCAPGLCTCNPMTGSTETVGRTHPQLHPFWPWSLSSTYVDTNINEKICDQSFVHYSTPTAAQQTSECSAIIFTMKLKAWNPVDSAWAPHLIGVKLVPFFHTNIGSDFQSIGQFWCVWKMANLNSNTTLVCMKEKIWFTWFFNERIYVVIKLKEKCSY